MTTIQKSVDVATPVRTAYDQWTQFESFPSFMEGVDEITQQTPTRTHWRTTIGGVTREFDAEISEQSPDERIAWHSVSGPRQAGVVTFHRIDDRTTRVHLQLEYQPDSLTEKAGAALGMVGHRIQGDLARFKEFVERHGETGAWRGEVDRPPQRGERPAGDRGGTSSRSVPPGGLDADPGFASEHSLPTHSDHPTVEGPDESVPHDRGGPGGMDVR